MLRWIVNFVVTSSYVTLDRKYCGNVQFYFTLDREYCGNVHLCYVGS
jgi:hypothetical protein